jgi:hypothetical protein
VMGTRIGRAVAGQRGRTEQPVDCPGRASHRPAWMVGMTVNDVARLLPDPDTLRDHCRALALLDAILSPDWSSRYYSFKARWSPTEEMASMVDSRQVSSRTARQPICRLMTRADPVRPAALGCGWGLSAGAG